MKLDDLSAVLDARNAAVTASIIKNQVAFTDDWIDPEVIGRDDFFRRVASYISKYQAGKPFHLVVNGQQGIGKSFLVKSILHSVKELSKSPNFPLIQYIQCDAVRNNVLSFISKSIKSKNISSNSDIIDIIQSNGVILVFDDLDVVKRVDRFIRKNIPQFLQMQMSTIYITQKAHAILTILNNIFPKIDFELINLHPYTEDEMVEILEHRARGGFSDEICKSISNFIFRYISQKVVEYSKSDCRLAIRILYESVIEANRRGVPVNLPIVNEIIGKFQSYFFENVKLKFNLMNSYDLYFLLILCNNIKSVPQQKMYENYLELLNNKRLKPRSYMWFHNQLKVAEQLNLISIQKTGGRGNIKNIITFVADALIFRNYIQSEVDTHVI